MSKSTAQPHTKMALLALTAGLFLWLVKPFIPPLVLGGLFAIAFTPAYRRIHQKIPHRALAGVLTLALGLALLITPFALLIGLIAQEALTFIQTFDPESTLQIFEHYESLTVLGYSLDLNQVNTTLQSFLQEAGQVAYTGATQLGASLAEFGVQFMVFLLLWFYLLVDGPLILKRLQPLLPYSKRQQATLFQKLRNVSHTIFMGNLSLAVISGLAGFIGFRLVGAPAPAIWGLLVGIFSLIPTLGTLLIYLIGIALVGTVNGLALGVSGGLGFGLGLLAFYVIVDVILIQNLLTPKLLDDQLGVHPILVFFALVGGVEAFGSMGLIYGPLIVVGLLTLIEFSTASSKA